MPHPSTLLDRVDDIIGRWRSTLRGSPDPTPRTDTRGIAERRLVQSLIRAGLQPDDENVLQTLAISAASYGMLEPLRHLEPERVLESLGLLRQAIWEELVELIPRCAEGSRDHWSAATNFILNVDRAMDVATRAAMVNSQDPVAA